MMRRVATAALAIGIPLLSADAAAACSCVPPNERKLLRESDGAFVGRLVAVGSGNPTDFIYRVGRVYNRGPGLYALFLQRRNHRWHSNLCLTTTPRRMRRAAEDASASPAGSPGSAGCA